MPEERICPACGRANALDARTCQNCAAAFGGAVLLSQDAGRQAAYSSEFPVVRDGSWRGVSTQKEKIPLPPQIQAEQRRRELEWERRAAEQQAAVRRREEAEGKVAEEHQRRLRVHEAAAEVMRAEHEEHSRRVGAARTVTRVCGRCGTAPEEIAGTRFSFCLKCGADLTESKAAAGTEPGTASPPSTDAALRGETGPRSYREAMLQRRARYRSRVGAAREEAAARVASAREEKLAAAGAAEVQAYGATVSPASAAVWSFLLPGVGQMLNGQVGKGALLLLALWIATGAFDLPAFGLTLVVARALIAVDAYRTGERRRRGEPVHTWEWNIG